MPETIIDSTSIASGGGTATGQFGHDPERDVATVVISGYDSNSTDLDVAATGAAPRANGTVRDLSDGGSVTAIDASTNGRVLTLTGLRGIARVEVTVTNNAASSTTVTVEEDTPA